MAPVSISLLSVIYEFKALINKLLKKSDITCLETIPEFVLCNLRTELKSY